MEFGIPPIIDTMNYSDTSVDFDFLRYNSFLSALHGIFYVATPKVACTALKWWFAELEGCSDDLRKVTFSSESDPSLVIHDTFHIVAPSVTGLGPETLSKVLSSDEFFRFALVRNPYHRIFSAWQSKLLLQEPLQSSPYLNCDFYNLRVASPDDVKVAFEAFLVHLSEREANSFWDKHWTPQVQILRPGTIDYSLISKLEDTALLVSALAVRLGRVFCNPFEQMRENQSLIPFHPSLISHRSAELIRLLYRDDFETFGYINDVPLQETDFSEEQCALALRAVTLIRGRHRQLRVRQEQMHDLVLRASHWEARAAELQSAATDNDSRVEELGLSVRELQSRLSRMAASEAAQSTQLIAIQSERDKAIKEHAEGDRRIAALSDSLASHQEQLEALGRELAMMRAQSEERAAQLMLVQSERNKAVRELAEVTSRLADADTRISTLSASLTECQLQLATCEAEIAKLTDQHILAAKTPHSQQAELALLRAEVFALRRSLSWRITKPLRSAAKPLLILAGGAKLSWVAIRLGGGVWATAKLLVRVLRTEGLYGVRWRLQNAHSFVDNDSAFLSTPDNRPLEVPTKDEFVPLCTGTAVKHPPAKIICFYLPQFHAIPENNEWWGEGFTEWTNVRPAQSQFDGHYQPHVPGELGYYDLLDRTVQHRQVELAELYGIGGFCFYFYWFGGRRLLETPVLNYLQDKSLKLPFCLCWANENWSRRWDGLEGEVLIAQQHSSDDDIAFIRYISQYMKDSRYIRVNGKPLLLVYRPNLLPDARETARRWRHWCKVNAIGDIFLAYTQSFESVDPATYGFDAAVEFPPNNSAPPNITKTTLGGESAFEGTIYDWSAFVERSKKYNEVNYALFRGVCPSWDNTARRRNHSTVFLNSTPTLFQKWLTNAIRDTVANKPDASERLVFLNAWNEWAEGAHLEPDMRYGYAYLQAVRNALTECTHPHVGSILLVTHDCHPHGAQFLLLEVARQLKRMNFSVSVVSLGSGKLSEDFRSIGNTIDASTTPETDLRQFLRTLRGQGITSAITSTVVCGSLLPELKAAGFNVLSLIHELPGVICQMKQEANAEQIARLADFIVFPSPYVHDRFAEIANADPERVYIRPQGVLRRNPFKYCRELAHVEVCKRHQLPPDSKIVLSIAYADARKGPDIFVEVALQVLSVENNAIFIWIGHADTSILRKIQASIQHAGLTDKVLFLGFDPDPLVYYAAASVYALTSREDPFPNVVLESAEVGLPVVAFEGATGAAEFISLHGGVLAPYLDVHKYAQAVYRVLQAQSPALAPKTNSLQQYVLDLLNRISAVPRISVVVPNYNYADYLVSRLDTICNQTFPIYEIIVIDDASTDESVDIITKYIRGCSHDIQLITSKTNSGSVFRQWRTGVQACSGDLVWIAEADDLAEPTFLQALVPQLASSSTVLAYCQSKQIDEAGKVISADYLTYTKDISDDYLKDFIKPGIHEIQQALCVKNTIPNVSGVLFRRDILLETLTEIGDELVSFQVAGDWFLYLHLLTRGHIGYNSSSLNLHRRHTRSVTRSLTKARHLEEVKRVQAVARDLVDISPVKTLMAEEYLKRLHAQFEIPYASTEV